MLTRRKINIALDKVYDYIVSKVHNNGIKNAATNVVRKNKELLDVDYKSAIEKTNRKKNRVF